MSFDGSFTHAMNHELNEKLVSGRVSKISEPYPNEIILTIRANQQNYHLLLSANPTYARVQITEVPFTNPPHPTNFAMTLRKYLSGSFLTKIHQVQNDRILHFHFNTRNDLGDQEELVLIIEIMARHSNIILAQASDSIIVDSVKRITSAKSRFRTILPGSSYVQPPKQDMVNPFELTSHEANHVEKINHDFPNVEVAAGEYRKYLQGLGKDTAFALSSALHQSEKTFSDNFADFFHSFDSPQPAIGTDNQGKLQFAPFPFAGLINIQPCDSLSQMLDKYYQKLVRQERVRELGSQLVKVTQTNLKRNKRKLKKLEKTYAESQYADDLRIKGEVLMTYLNQVDVGASSVTLPNFYDNNQDIIINLDPALSASENAQRYFKKYDKKKKSKIFVESQIKETKEEISYLENLQDQIELANPGDLPDIKTELKSEGYLKNSEKNGRKKRRQQVSKPERFVSDDGEVILVGKNNLQNDQLTQKIADKRDTWLHVQNIHGSHVVVRSFDPSEKTIVQAAELAAYFSKARDSANVPVDYLKIKNVKKPSGAKPGFVTFRGQQTIYVTPSLEKVEHLKNNDK